jgi:ABC-2 type transport system ATP-binding protein
VSIRADGLTVRFPRRLFKPRLTALDGVDLEVRDGDFFALLGQNGAGKSTAMHCFLGLLRPTAGRVEIFGQRPEPGAALFRDVGYLPEEPRYHDYLTVEEAVTYYARLSGVAAPAARVTRADRAAGAGRAPRPGAAALLDRTATRSRSTRCRPTCRI